MNLDMWRVRKTGNLLDIIYERSLMLLLSPKTKMGYMYFSILDRGLSFVSDFREIDFFCANETRYDLLNVHVSRHPTYIIAFSYPPTIVVYVIARPCLRVGISTALFMSSFLPV